MTTALYTLGPAAIYLVLGSWLVRRIAWRLEMADADFPSDYEREIHRNERAVDEHRRRQELEAEVERLRALNAELAYSLRGFVYFPTVALNGLDLDELRKSIEAEAMEIIGRAERRT